MRTQQTLHSAHVLEPFTMEPRTLDFRKRMSSYAEDQYLGALFEALLHAAVVAKPKDPITFLISEVRLCTRGVYL